MISWTKKTCPKCHKGKLRKFGKRFGYQRYQCKECKYVLNTKANQKRLVKKIWEEYTTGKQTQKELANEFNLSEKTIRSKLKGVELNEGEIEEEETFVLADTTYFGRNFGVMVFRSAELKKNLYWKIVQYETIIGYLEGLDHLKSKGVKIKGLVCDGRRGIFKAVTDIPVQMCQFHQVAIVRRYLTSNPKLEASIELMTITRRLKDSKRAEFEYEILEWGKRWNSFLKEKTINEDTKKWYYTHKRLRSAYRSLKGNLDKLFVYQEHEGMPNTNNGLEGIFTELKTQLRLHKGVKFEMKRKLIFAILGKHLST